MRQRTRLKNQVHAILARNLVPRWPAADLFGIKGRKWLSAQALPADEQAAAAALLRQLDFHAQQLALIDADLGQAALARPEVLRLMTIPGVDATVALSIVAAVGDFTRFRTPDRLVAYFGLNPRVRQSGGQPASHGRITNPMQLGCQAGSISIWRQPRDLDEELNSPGRSKRSPAMCPLGRSSSRAPP